MADKYIAIGTSGKREEVEATVTSAGVANAGDIVALNSAGELDPSLFPTGLGEDVKSLTAEVPLSAGDFVNINPATGEVRLADNSNNRPAHGFVLDAAAAAATVNVYFEGGNTALTGLTPGTPYFLDTAGNVTATPPTATGEILQCLGIATDATSINVEFDPPILRA